VDPTANVSALNEAGNKRQDDLRALQFELIQTQLRLLQKQMRDESGHAKEMAQAESRRVDRELALRAAYEERLAKAEAGRIDAIRAVDVNAVAVASQRAADAAGVLQNQVSTSAEALRNLVANTATTTAQQLQQLVAGLSTRIQTLEQAGYLSQGKQQVSDPALVDLATAVRRLESSASQNTGKNEGISAAWLVIVAVIGIGIAGVGLVVALRPASSPVPQIQYAPVGPLTVPTAPVRSAP
jgi:hypothetical protein